MPICISAYWISARCQTTNSPIRVSNIYKSSKINELVVLHLKDAESSFCTDELITVNYCHKIICTRHNSATSVPLSEKGEQQIYTRFVDCGCTYEFVVQSFDCKTKGHLNVTLGEVSLDLNGTTNQKRGKH